MLLVASAQHSMHCRKGSGLNAVDEESAARIDTREAQVAPGLVLAFEL